MRDDLLKYGYIDFRPQNLMLIDESNEIFKNGSVCIVNLSNTDINIGEEIVIERNRKFSKATIKEIHLNDKSVSAASNGEVGLLLSIPIKKKSILWKKTTM